jgi:AraC-like DNA-binding protein
MHSLTYALDATWRPLLKDLGISSVNVLRRAGLPEDLLAKPSARLGASDFYRFWNAIGQESQDPLLPIALCQTIRSESFSPPLFAAMASPNWSVAMQRIARYKRLVAPMRLDVRQQDQSVVIDLIWLVNQPTPPASLVLTELVFFVMLARMGTRQAMTPLRVQTPELPAQQEPYRRFLGLAIEPGPVPQISFSRADATAPFLTSNADLWAAFEPELRTRLAELDVSASLTQRVRAILLEALPGGSFDMGQVAGKLAMSRRTLQRQLEAEGTRYTSLLQQTRHALARHYLHKTGLPVAEISFLLGFEEPNSFYRAFRDWTGLSPEQVRRTGLAQFSMARSGDLSNLKRSDHELNRCDPEITGGHVGLLSG